MFKSAGTWSTWQFSRTHAADLDVSEVAEKSKAFGTALRQCDQVILVAQHTENGELLTWLLTNARNDAAASTAASTLAASVDAISMRTDDVLDLSAPVVGVVRQRASEIASRNNAAGANPGDIARAFSSNSEPGDWVAISLVSSKPKQVTNYRKWAKIRGASDSHFANSTSTVIGSVYVGSSSKSSARAVADLVMGMLPGFDVETICVFPSIGVAPWLSSGLGLAAWGGLTFGAHMPFEGGALGTVLSSYAPASALGAIPTPRSRLTQSVEAGTLPSPRKTTRASREESVNKQTGKIIEARTPYPLDVDAFLFTPVMVVGLVAPTSEAGSGAVRAARRDVPTTMRQLYGPLVGHDESGNEAHLDASRLYEGVGLIGLPGSGKSVAMRVCLGWNIAQRVRPDSNPASPGTRNTIFVFENKGLEGAQHCIDYANVLGDDVLVVDLSDESTLGIDMFDFPGSVSDRSQRFIEAMKYGFVDGSIQDRATEALNAIFPAAIFLSQRGEGSIMDIAHILAGGEGDKTALVYADKVTQIAASEGGEAVDVVRGMSVLFGEGRTPAQRNTLTESSRNKLDKLRRLTAWWNPSRKRASWIDLIKNHEMVVINLGSSMDPSKPTVSSEQTTLMSSMLMFTLRDAIMMTCNGWRDEGRSVSIFADELSLLAGTSPEVITTLRDQGRSLGVRCYFGVQYPNQLDPKVRETVLGFSTLFWFAQNNPDSIESAVKDLTVTGHEWTSADIGSIPDYHAALRTRVGGAKQSPSLIKIGWWENNLDSFATDQRIFAEPVHGVVRHRPWEHDESKTTVSLAKEPVAVIDDVPPHDEEMPPPPEDDPSDPSRFSASW